MISNEKLFGNPFDGKEIIPQRLLQFAKDHLKRLVKANVAKQYDALIALVTAKITDLTDNLNDLDVNKTVQRSQTQTVDQVTTAFQGSMSSLDGVIARAIGGKTAGAYLEFYPHGITEYDQATRVTMPTLLNRIQKASTKYNKALAPDVVAELQGHVTSWNGSRDIQEDAKIEVVTNITDKPVAVLNMQLALVQSMHTIGALYPADSITCGSFFNYSLLYSFTHHTHDLHNGTLIFSETKLLINKILTDNTVINIANSGDNAAFRVWLSPTATGVPPDTAVEVQPGATVIVKPSDLGNLANPFLLINNESAVNVANYDVDIIG